jgi:hypothetical protein
VFETPQKAGNRSAMSLNKSGNSPKNLSSKRGTASNKDSMQTINSTSYPVKFTDDQRQHLLKMRQAVDRASSGNNVYSDQIYSKYLNRFRSGVNPNEGSLSSKKHSSKGSMVNGADGLPQIHQIYQRNVMAVGNSNSGTRNLKGNNIYQTEAVQGNRGIPVKAGEYFHHPGGGAK